MSLCILIGLGGAGKSNFSQFLIQRLASKEDRPMELPVEVDTVGMEEAAELAELEEQETEVDLCEILEETLQKLHIQEEIAQRQRKLRKELSNRYRKAFVEHKTDINATVKAIIEEFEAMLHRVTVDIQHCIDEKMDEFIRDTLGKKMHNYLVCPFSVHEPSFKKEVIDNGKRSRRSFRCKRRAEEIPLWKLTPRIRQEAPIRGYIRLQRPYLINCNMCGSVA